MADKKSGVNSVMEIKGLILRMRMRMRMRMRILSKRKKIR
jgi:hypothetical protein